MIAPAHYLCSGCNRQLVNFHKLALKTHTHAQRWVCLMTMNQSLHI